jgi:hypothetical protein
MAANSLTDLYVDRIDGDSTGQTVYSETRRILDKLFSLDLHRIENECNKVANLYHEKWTRKNPNDFMIEEDLQHTRYENGIRELHPPFLLTAPSTVHIQVFDFRIDALNPQYSNNREAAAATIVNSADPTNPNLMIFLPTLEIVNSMITWTHRPTTSFKSVIIHEFLHLCSDIPSPTNKIVDGVIRHTMVGTEAIASLIAG